MSINLDNMWWLARQQMRDNIAAYLYTAAYFAFMGLVLSSDQNLGVEVAFPIIMLILIQPSLSARYMTWKKDNEVVRHQIFLHSLPIGFTNIIAARVVAMLAAGLINIPLFFLPYWFLQDGWDSNANYIAWVAFWSGIALAGTGFALYQEFRMTLVSWTKFNFVLVLSVIAVVVLVLIVTDFRPVQASIDASNSHPWVLAISGLAIGIAGLVFAFGRAVSGFRRREFAT